MYSLVKKAVFTAGALSSQYQAVITLFKQSYVDTKNTIKIHNIEMNPFAMNLDVSGCPRANNKAKRKVLKVGVVETRYVSLKFCRPWVIHAYKNLKGRGVHKDADEGVTPMGQETDCSKKRKLDQDNSTLSESPQQCNLPSSFDEPPLVTSESASNQELLPRTVPDDTNITTQGSCDHMIKEPALQALDEDVMRAKELVSGSTSQETSNGQEQSSHILHKVSVLEKDVKSDLAGPADMEVDEDSNTAKSVNMELEGKADREEPSTSQQTRAEREEPSTSQQTRAEREEPSTSQQTRAERKRKLPTDVGKISNSEGYTSAKSSYDKVRVLCEPWKKPEGHLNRPAFKMMLESVMLFILQKPGSDIRELYKRYSPYLQPGVLNRLLEILEEIGCVTKQYVRPTKVSLFSKPFQISLVDEEDEGLRVLLVPTLECMFKLGQFGQIMYPGVTWPNLEELKS